MASSLMSLCLACSLAGCSRQPKATARRSDFASSDAKHETARVLREDAAAVRHESDGQGRAVLVEPRTASHGAPILTVGSRHRFVIDYYADPLGVDVGGAIAFLPSPFWGWDPPQTGVPAAPGYATVETDAPGVVLQPRVRNGLLMIEVTGRALRSNERVRIVYGAGPALARVDRYAEHDERLWLSVDGDGDGVRALVDDSPRVHIRAARPARLLVTLPTTARPGDAVHLTVAVVDAAGNAFIPVRGEARLTGVKGLGLPERIALKSEHDGCRRVAGVAEREGVYRIESRLRLSERSTLAGTSNPLVVRKGIPPLRWADLHGHSQISDGTGTPEDYFRYARDVAALDIAALTDHDHWGMRFLDMRPDLWREIRMTARRFDAPGRFIALAGYEWTSWLYGHRHVLYFGEDGDVLSALDAKSETPALLFEALAGRKALTVAHHSAGGPISTSWRFRPEPSIEPVTEIVSVHGSSEAEDSPGLIYNPVSGNFVRDALSKGFVLGFVGSGDSHDGHPGRARLSSPCGGLAAIFSDELTRDGVLSALRKRLAYATNGPRIWLRIWLDGHPMGTILSPAPDGARAHRLRIVVAAETPLASVEIIRGDGDRREFDAGGRLDWHSEHAIPPLADQERLYVRVRQRDGGAAWSSPFFARFSD
ncbi:MAG: CehA/McbA family metallohydrolase [Vicinamibacteria bacterium]|nr:CehA/McbA family metallohydrolase [Vicinamibacteria bacterium]